MGSQQALARNQVVPEGAYLGPALSQLRGMALEVLWHLNLDSLPQTHPARFLSSQPRSTGTVACRESEWEVSLRSVSSAALECNNGFLSHSKPTKRHSDPLAADVRCAPGCTRSLKLTPALFFPGL